MPRVLAVEARDIERCWLLSGMRMLRPFVDAQIAKLLAPEGPAREHPLHCFFYDALRKPAFQNGFGRAFLDTPWIAGKMVVDFLFALVAGQHNLFRVDNNDVVAVIHMRSEFGLMLAAQP